MKKYLRLKFFLIVSTIVGLLAPFGLVYAQGTDVGTPIVASVMKATGGMFSLSGIAAKVIGWIAYSIGYLISSLASVVIMLQTWIIQIVLHMNGQVIQSAIVQNGFQVTLSIANLGFLTALIVIAVATILRRETYGIKQLLWKLIVAALLVNFSLVFVGVIINFSDQLTNYFLKAFPGQGGGSIITNNPYDAGASNFAERLVVAFQPQQYLAATGGKDGGNVDLATRANAGWGSFASTAGSSIGQMLAPIASIIMVTLGLITIVIILAVFSFMLVVRYIYLSILIILMPLAWVAWIFPSMQKHWGEWWGKFLKWTFFAPIVIFFMWLVITTGSVMGNDQNTGSPFYGVEANFSSTAGGLTGGISNFFGGAFTPIILTFLKGIVLVLLMGGGLMVANSLSITGAKAGIAAAQKLGKGVQGYAVRKGKQIGTAPFRGKAGQTLANKMQGVGAGKGFFGKLVTAPIRYGGRGLEAVGGAQGEKMVSESEGRLKDLTTDQLIHGMSTMPAHDRIAAVGRIHKEGRISEVANLDSYIGDQKEDEFNRYGKGSLLKQVQDESGWRAAQLAKEKMAAEDMKPEMAKAKIIGDAGEELKAAEKMKDGAEREEKIKATKQKLEAAKNMGDEDAKAKLVTDAQDKLNKHFRAAPNPGLLGETFFQDPDKLKKTGGFPLGLKEDEYSKMQQVVARGVATGFAPNNAAKFFDKLNRGDQLDAFTKASEREGVKNEEISERLKNYLGGSGAKNLGVSVEIFGEQAKTPKISVISSKSSVGEEIKKAKERGESFG
ncbi:MAG: hypothetical protein WCX12_02945 [Candidatus Paceibacterota bacterium]|jgi:hypothetical protein